MIGSNSINSFLIINNANDMLSLIVGILNIYNFKEAESRLVYIHFSR